MRSPSGERQRKSVTKRIPRAVVSKHPGARALQALVGDDDLVGAAVEFGLRDAVRPDDPCDVDARARAQAEVHGRAGDRLLLDEQAGSDFDVAADAERVDPLIARDGLRARTDHLPVVARRASSQQAHRSPIRESDQIEVTVGVQVRDAADRPDPARPPGAEARFVRPRATRGNDLHLRPPRRGRRCCRDPQGARGGCPARAGRTSRARWPASGQPIRRGPWTFGGLRRQRRASPRPAHCRR